VEPTLMVVGLNHRTAPLGMRERFWIGENLRYAALRQLKDAEGLEEVIVLSTRCRTEFLLWASEPTLAANSLVHYLSVEHGLKLSEWEHFYRRLDEAALAHIFRLACGLDCQLLCAEAASRLRNAWEQARTVGASGPYLKTVLEKAFGVAERVRGENASQKLAVPIPTAALGLARQIFGSLQGRNILLLGAGEMNELSARMMAESGAGSVVVIDQVPARAQELAQQLGGTAATLADRWRCLLRADIVISATGCPHVVLTREEAERIAAERNRVALVIIDLGMPRDVDPEVRRVDGILLYDFEGLERTIRHPAAAERAAAAAELEKIVAAEVQSFRGRLKAESVAPTIVALRHRLDEICRQELASFIAEHGPFTREEDHSLHAITTQVIQKIASSLARELKDVPEKEEQQQMAVAVARLFHLDSPQQALAGAISEKTKSGPSKGAVAINY